MRRCLPGRMHCEGWLRSETFHLLAPSLFDLQLEEQQKQEQAMAAQRGPCPTCLAAEQQGAELEKLRAKVDELQDGIAAARTAADVQLAHAAADAQAQQQVGLWQSLEPRGFRLCWAAERTLPARRRFWFTQ